MIKSIEYTGDRSVGDSIKALRTERGLTIRELAARTGLSAAAISRWESGQRVPSVDSFNKVVTALDAELTVISK